MGYWHKGNLCRVLVFAKGLASCVPLFNDTPLKQLISSKNGMCQFWMATFFPGCHFFEQRQKNICQKKLIG